MYNSN